MAERQLDLLAPHTADSNFVVRRSPRARHMAISVGAHGVVEVVVPKSARPAAVEAFVTKHRAWIDRALAEYAATHPPVDRSMPEVIVLPAIGREYAVRYDARRTAETGKVLNVAGNRDDRPHCRAQLRLWLRKLGNKTLVPRLAELSAETDLQYKRVQVRGQRTRWGSYSSSGTLSINYCLLFLTPELVDHLLIHELCHTRHLNHSRRFWRLVSGYSPDYRALEKRLDASWRDVPAWLALH